MAVESVKCMKCGEGCHFVHGAEEYFICKKCKTKHKVVEFGYPEPSTFKVV